MLTYIGQKFTSYSKVGWLSWSNSGTVFTSRFSDVSEHSDNGAVSVGAESGQCNWLGFADFNAIVPSVSGKVSLFCGLSAGIAETST